MRIKNKAGYVSVCAMCTALVTVCSWISIPSSPPFTLQSFAVFAVTGIFGTSVAFSAYFLYVLLGFLGLPVFSCFKGGIAVLTGPTGGYIIGFGVSILTAGLIIRIFGRSSCLLLLSFTAGTLVLYAFGALFYSFAVLGSLNAGSVGSSFVICVLPFVLFDIVKLVAAVLVTKRLEGRIRI